MSFDRSASSTAAPESPSSRAATMRISHDGSPSSGANGRTTEGLSTEPRAIWESPWMAWTRARSGAPLLAATPSSVASSPRRTSSHCASNRTRRSTCPRNVASREASSCSQSPPSSDCTSSTSPCSAADRTFGTKRQSLPFPSPSQPWTQSLTHSAPSGPTSASVARTLRKVSSSSIGAKLAPLGPTRKVRIELLAAPPRKSQRKKRWSKCLPSPVPG